jgi:ribulose-phosphate 3-epimerase
MKDRKNTKLIGPSILSADFARLGEEVTALEKSGVDFIHFDVMDNHFVPNLTFGPCICKAIRPHVDLPIDVHLMTEGVDDLIVNFAEAGANMISIHPESVYHLSRSLSLIRGKGCEAGIDFNPATPLSYLDWVMNDIDFVLVMSVNPGFGGQPLIENSIEKVKEVRLKIDAFEMANRKKKIRLEIDGGVKLENIRTLALKGVDMFVVGSGIFNNRDKNDFLSYTNIVRKMRKELDS